MIVEGFRRKLAIAAFICMTTAVSTPTPSNAQPHRGGYFMITAVSNYGAQTITAPVRPGRLGREVRLPGGTWISCAGDCRDTLRQETVDFFYKFEDRSRSRR